MKQRILSVLLAFTLLIGIVPFVQTDAHAVYGQCGPNITWGITSDGALQLTGTGEMYEYGFTEVPWYYQGGNSVGKIIISEGITGISNYAFMGCAKATSVSIPSTLVSVGSNAFDGCIKLKSLSFPQDLYKLGNYTFNGCSSLTSIQFGGDVTNYGSNIFQGCPSSLTITRPFCAKGFDQAPWTSVKQKTYNPAPFSDVSSKAWYYNPVSRACMKGFFSGTSRTTFSPNIALSRAMIVQVLYSMEGKPACTAENPFTDVPENKWYHDAIVWASSQHIVSGTGENTFSPERNLTREQAAVILTAFANRYHDLSMMAADLSRFSDAGDISPWAVQAMRQAVGAGLISGTPDGKLNPKKAITRAEAAQIIVTYDDNSSPF